VCCAERCRSRQGLKLISAFLETALADACAIRALAHSRSVSKRTRRNSSDAVVGMEEREVLAGMLQATEC